MNQEGAKLVHDATKEPQFHRYTMNKLSLVPTGVSAGRKSMRANHLSCFNARVTQQNFNKFFVTARTCDTEGSNLLIVLFSNQLKPFAPIFLPYGNSRVKFSMFKQQFHSCYVFMCTGNEKRSFL